jgi:hypothetical protein
MRICVLTAATVLALAALPAAAQTMKPGLWEINNKASGGQAGDAMAEMQKQMAQMPPEQRKQMEAMMAQRGVRMAPAAGGGMTMQMCMTKEMVERNEVPTRDGCTSTSQKGSGNTIKVAFSCKSPPTQGEGEVKFTPESYTSHMTVKTTEGGRTDTMVMDAAGKWLKADCGSVKPMAQAR